MSSDIFSHEHVWFKNPDSKSGSEFCRECLAMRPEQVGLAREKEAMKVVCAWCRKYLRGDRKAVRISHGICSDCDSKQFADEVAL